MVGVRTRRSPRGFAMTCFSFWRSPLWIFRRKGWKVEANGYLITLKSCVWLPKTGHCDDIKPIEITYKQQTSIKILIQMWGVPKLWGYPKRSKSLGHDLVLKQPWWRSPIFRNHVYICIYIYISLVSHYIIFHYWLVVYLPHWKIWLRQLGLWNSQYMESHKIHVPNHQPDIKNN